VATPAAFEINYSPLDRLLHRIAFSVPALQLTASSIEESLLNQAYDSVGAAKPIFITSLPRAGTTLFLSMLNLFPEAATHIYRDMPFVMAPILWSRLSSAFLKAAESKERAHSDGMTFSYDSPEAFDEVFWRTFWPEKYSADRIDLWIPTDAKEDARCFFRQHMKKIITLRCPGRSENARYLSKNNCNIARLDFIAKQFPDAAIVVPFRAPLRQAASLLRQHQNFTKLHQNRPFARRYMADIGHFEFGMLHRAIAFPQLETLIAGKSPATVDYWLAYWVAAFEYVLERAGPLLLVSYDRACSDPVSVVSELCRQLGVSSGAALDQAVALFRPSTVVEETPGASDSGLVERAERIHALLLQRSCETAQER
jgi:hypothetical protein